MPKADSAKISTTVSTSSKCWSRRCANARAEIPLLANYFVERYAKLYRRDGFTIPLSVMERLARHRYPGNVRELENSSSE